MPSADYTRRQLERLDADESKLRTALRKQDATNVKLAKELDRKQKALAKSSTAATLKTRARQVETAAKNLRRGNELAQKISAKIPPVNTKRTRLQRQLDRAIATETRRQARPVVRYIERIREVAPPAYESLRVLYLIANPDPSDRLIRPDVEIRQVRRVVERAVHADAIEISDRHAVTFEDLQHELQRLRPHVVHFSGHAGPSMLEFDNAQIAPHNRPVRKSFDDVAKVLAECGQSVKLLVLNACDTLDGAEVFLESVPVVVATTRSIADMEAVVFASNFYSSIAAGESVSTALSEGRNAIEVACATDSTVIESLAREGLDLNSLILVETGEPEAPTADLSGEEFTDTDI